MELPDFHIPHAEKIEWMIETNGWALEPIAADPTTAPPTAACPYSIGLGAAVGFLLFPTNQAMIFLGAVTATFLESYSGPIDDNLTIPLGSALVLSFVA